MEKTNDSSIADNQARFMETLEGFMEQCFTFIENQKEPKLPPMTEEERLAKIKAITDLIQEKEKELLLLEAQRDALSILTATPQKTPQQKSAQTSPVTNYKCKKDCGAECNANKTV